MIEIKNRLIVTGIILCISGVAIEILSTNLITYLVNEFGRQDALIGLGLNFIVSLVRFCIAPLGASFVAIGITIGMLSKAGVLKVDRNFEKDS